jgi:hypothetical protein
MRTCGIHPSTPPWHSGSIFTTHQILRLLATRLSPSRSCDRIEGNVARGLNVGPFQFNCRYLRGFTSCTDLQDTGGQRTCSATPHRYTSSRTTTTAPSVILMELSVTHIK